MAYLSDKYKKISKDTFEDLIAVGMRKDQIMKVFNMSGKDLDKFCLDTYGNGSFNTVFDLIRMQAVGEFLDAMNEIGKRGNTSAISIMKELILEMNDKKDDVVKIQFVNNIDKENKDGKVDSGESKESSDSRK